MISPWKRLFGSTSATGTGSVVGASPVGLIQERLDVIGIPVRDTLQQLVARHGIAKSRFYDWDVLELANAKPLMSQQVCPFWFNVIGVESDLLPPEQWATLIGGSPDAYANHAGALAELEGMFGRAAPSKIAANTLCHLWQQGEYSLQLITWPSDRNQEDCNPSHARHPELRSYSHLYLHCRAVLEPGADEIIAMATASMVSVPSGARSVAIVSVPHNRASAHRELSRRTPDSLRDRGPGIGFSADNATLVVIRDDNCLIIPRDIVTGVALDRVKPAKGPGGANLVVEYEDPFSSAHRRRWITLYTSDAIGGLDELASVFALWAERTLKVEASDDV